MVRKSVWGNAGGTDLSTLKFCGLLRKPGWFFSWTVSFFYGTLETESKPKGAKPGSRHVVFGIACDGQYKGHDLWQPIPWSFLVSQAHDEESAHSCSQSSDPWVALKGELGTENRFSPLVWNTLMLSKMTLHRLSIVPTHSSLISWKKSPSSKILWDLIWFNFCNQ